MATLEKRGNQYRIVFWISGQRFSRSLKTRSERDANANLIRFDDNFRRYELGLLIPPDGTDIATFLLSDGKASAKPSLPGLRTLGQLVDNYFDSIPEGTLEETTLAGMRIHVARMKRILGANFPIQSLEAAHLQGYIEKRAKDKGIHGRKVSAATVKKDLVTLRTIWNWSINMGLLQKPFPNRGLRFPKLAEKPPFQTFAEVERRVTRGGLTPAERSDLWDCAFLTLDDVREVLEHVKQTARQRFIYPMFLFAAHTGARRSEMLRALIDDVDFASGTVSLQERKRVKGKLSRRRVPLSPLLLAVLRDWIDHHPGGRHLLCHDLDVPNSRKERTIPEPVTRDEAHDHFRRSLASTKWQHLRGWHIFRHSFCSNLAANGIDQRLISAWVGHQTQEMEARYRHLIPSHEQSALASVFA